MGTKKISEFDIILFLILIPYLKPFNVTLIPSLNMIFGVWKVLATLYIVVLWSTKNFYLVKSSRWLLLFCIIIAISTLRNTGGLGSNLQSLLSIFGIVILFSVYENKYGFIKHILAVMGIIAKAYIVLNTITVINQHPIFADIPEETYLRFFLGGDNYWAFILIPLCGIMFSCDYYNHKKIRLNTWIFALVGWADLVAQFAVSGMISYLLLLVSVAFVNFPILRRFTKPRYIIIFTIIFLIEVVYFNIIDYINPILASLFGTDKVGLNSRVIIWGDAVSAILKKPLFGYGKLNADQVSGYILYGAEHAHNFILELLMESGIIGTLCFMKWLYEVLKRIRVKKAPKYAIVLLFTFLALLVNGIFDYYVMLIYPYILIFLINSVGNNREKINDKYTYKLYTNSTMEKVRM